MMCTIQSRTAFRIFCLWLKHASVLLLLKSVHFFVFLDFLHKEGVARPQPLSWGEHILLKGAFKWYWWSPFPPSLESTITWIGPHISSVEMLQKYEKVNYHWKIHALLITCKIYPKKLGDSPKNVDSIQWINIVKIIRLWKKFTKLSSEYFICLCQWGQGEVQGLKKITKFFSNVLNWSFLSGEKHFLHFYRMGFSRIFERPPQIILSWNWTGREYL